MQAAAAAASSGSPGLMLPSSDVLFHVGGKASSPSPASSTATDLLLSRAISSSSMPPPPPSSSGSAASLQSFALPPPPRATAAGPSTSSSSSAAASAAAAAPAPASLSSSSSSSAEPSARTRPPPPARAPGCRDVTEFQAAAKIGAGRYGEVYHAVDPQTGEAVALKKLGFEAESEGFPQWAVRELTALQTLGCHPNVVRLREVATGRNATKENKGLGDVFLVLDFVENSLAGLLSAAKLGGSSFAMTADRVRSYMHQLLSVLAFMHARGWVHRDLKPPNLLVTAGNVLKLADFGLAKAMEPGRAMTDRAICTLWYRAPELLFMDPAAGPPLDVWSAGCIFGELLTGKLTFFGDVELDQLNAIYKLCGVPDHADWPELARLPGWVRFRPKNTRFTPQFRSRYAHIPPLALDLLGRLLTFSPHTRITAAQALLHPYFTQSDQPPVPAPETLPRITLATGHEVRDAASRGQRAAGAGAAADAAAAPHGFMGDPPPAAVTAAAAAQRKRRLSACDGDVDDGEAGDGSDAGGGAVRAAKRAREAHPGGPAAAAATLPAAAAAASAPSAPDTARDPSVSSSTARSGSVVMVVARPPPPSAAAPAAVQAVLSKLGRAGAGRGGLPALPLLRGLPLALPARAPGALALRGPSLAPVGAPAPPAALAPAAAASALPPPPPPSAAQPPAASASGAIDDASDLFLPAGASRRR